MMGSFDETDFEKKLLYLKDTHDSISNLSSWCLSHQDHHSRIVSIWLSVLKRVKMEHRLLLFYLANDVIQYSKRKGLPFLNSFAPALQKATTMVRGESIRNKILRLFKIWDERHVYDDSFLVDLSGLLSTGYRTSNKIDVQDFQPTTLFSRMRSCKALEDDTDLKLKVVNENHTTLTDISKMRSTLKDREHSRDKMSEVQEGIDKIQSYINALEAEIKERTGLIDLLEIADQYYEKELGEAKVVVNAYRCFGNRVKGVKRKLDDRIPELPIVPTSPSMVVFSADVLMAPEQPPLPITSNPAVTSTVKIAQTGYNPVLESASSKNIKVSPDTPASPDTFSPGFYIENRVQPASQLQIPSYASGVNSSQYSIVSPKNDSIFSANNSWDSTMSHYLTSYTNPPPPDENPPDTPETNVSSTDVCDASLDTSQDKYEVERNEESSVNTAPSLNISTLLQSLIPKTETSRPLEPPPLPPSPLQLSNVASSTPKLTTWGGVKSDWDSPESPPSEKLSFSESFHESSSSGLDIDMRFKDVDDRTLLNLSGIQGSTWSSNDQTVEASKIRLDEGTSLTINTDVPPTQPPLPHQPPKPPRAFLESSDNVENVDMDLSDDEDHRRIDISIPNSASIASNYIGNPIHPPSSIEVSMSSSKKDLTSQIKKENVINYGISCSPATSKVLDDVKTPILNYSVAPPKLPSSLENGYSPSAAVFSTQDFISVKNTIPLLPPPPPPPPPERPSWIPAFNPYPPRFDACPPPPPLQDTPMLFRPPLPRGPPRHQFRAFNRHPRFQRW